MNFFALLGIEASIINEDVDTYNMFKDYLFALYHSVMQQTFDLVYYGHFSAEYVDDLSPTERKEFIEMVKDAIDTKDKAISEAFSAMQTP